MRRSLWRSAGLGMFGVMIASCSEADDLTGHYVYEQNPRATLSIGGGAITAGGGPTTVSAAYRIESKAETPASEGRPRQQSFRVSLSMPGVNPAQVTMTLTNNVLVVEDAFYAFGGCWVKR